MLLNRDALLKKEELKIEKVIFDDGDFVYVRQMYGKERENFEKSILKEIRDENGNIKDYEQSLDDIRAKLAVNTLCDEKGDNLLKPEDYVILSQNMGAERLEKIADVAARLNKVGVRDRELLVKNFEGGPAADSASGSAKK